MSQVSSSEVLFVPLVLTVVPKRLLPTLNSNTVMLGPYNSLSESTQAHTCTHTCVRKGNGRPANAR